MKKLLVTLIAAMVGVSAFAGTRIIDQQPATNDVLAISITDASLLKSISNDITAAGETNSFTITYTTDDSVTYTLATAVADQIAGAETVSYYNYDNDSSTGNTVVLKRGDTLYLTGNDATQTDYSNVWYRVVIETID